MAPPGHLGNGGGRTCCCHLDVCMYTCMHTVRVNSYIQEPGGGENGKLAIRQDWVSVMLAKVSVVSF